MTLAEVRAQQGTVEREALLGRYMWYSVPESTMLDYDVIVDALGDVGLTKKLPKPPREYDVFRRVTKESQRRKIPHRENGVTIPGVIENWLVRDVSSNREDVITRRLVVEVVSPDETMVHEQIVDLQYVRPTAQQTKGRVEFHWLNGHTAAKWPIADAITQTVYSEYTRWQGKLAHASIRHWIQQTIVGFGAIQARVTGGIYFLEEQYADQVEALEAFCATHLPEGGECHSVEIIDNKKQRDLIHKAIVRETIGAIEDITAEVQECRRDGKLTSKKYLDIQKRVALVDSKMGNYMKLLDRDGTSIQARLKLLHGLAEELSPLQARITRKRKPKAAPEPVEEATPAKPVNAAIAHLVDQ